LRGSSATFRVCLVEDGHSRSSFLVDHDAELDASAFRVQELDAFHFKLEFLDLLSIQVSTFRGMSFLNLRLFDLRAKNRFMECSA
jgi:hypothetical protein